MVVSGDVGAVKPDPVIFEAATEAIPADERVFVADGLERDVVPAQEAGFTGVYVDGEDDGGDERSGADVRVRSVGEVPDVLG